VYLLIRAEGMRGRVVLFETQKIITGKEAMQWAGAPSTCKA